MREAALNVVARLFQLVLRLDALWGAANFKLRGTAVCKDVAVDSVTCGKLCPPVPLQTVDSPAPELDRPDLNDDARFELDDTSAVS